MKNLPNILTIFRIISLPVLILMILSSEQKFNFYTVLLFVTISASDFFDGYFARKMRLESSFGKMLDPIADKLFIITEHNEAIVRAFGHNAHPFDSIPDLLNFIKPLASNDTNILVKASRFMNFEIIVDDLKS